MSVRAQQIVPGFPGVMHTCATGSLVTLSVTRPYIANVLALARSCSSFFASRRVTYALVAMSHPMAPPVASSCLQVALF